MGYFRPQTQEEKIFDAKCRACDYDRGYCYHCVLGGKCPISDPNYIPLESELIHSVLVWERGENPLDEKSD